MLDKDLELALAHPTLKEGRYVVAGVLGKGGNAGVYQAWDTSLLRWRAIKVLSHEFIKDDQIRARFAQEAATMARLDHKNLVQVYDISDDPFTPHIVMELCSGGSTIQWIKAYGAVPPHLALKIIESTALGVEAAHADNITHRDIKPQNILIDHKGVIKLTDFGIARDEDNSLTMAGATMGTYAFMAPEQRHDSTQVDWRADIYSLGATLFTLSKVKTTTELFVVDRDDELLAGVAEPIIDIILKCCAYKPKDRFQSVRELVAAIAEARTRLPPDPEHPPLNALAKPLPPSAPTDLPDFAKLEDLLKALALNDNTPTYTDRSSGSGLDSTTLGGTSGSPAPEKQVLPYYMDSSSPSDRAYDSFESSSQPSYLDQAQPEVQPREEQLLGANGSFLPAPEPEIEPEPESTLDPRLWGAFIGAMVLLILTCAVGLGLGAQQTSAAQANTRKAEATLLQSIERSAPVIQQIGRLGGDAAALQDAFFRVKDANSDLRGDVALQYAADLQNESQDRELSSVARGLVEAVSYDSEKLSSSRVEWQDAAQSLTGSIAIGVGIGNAPP